ncbi:MAG: cysteine desulfurase family protein [Anaerolineales bacterium]
MDYSATTPVDSRVVEAMSPFFTDSFGNPSSVHRFGQIAEAAVDSSRESVARVLNCSPDEIVFTSCGSESDNLAIRGAAYAMREKTGAKWILASRAEHPAVTKTLEHLGKYDGFLIEWLDVNEHGMVTPEIVAKAICGETAIVSVMYANNEIGTINLIKEIAEICRANKILFHTDAVQAAAYLPLDVNELGVDMMSLGAHKFYGPKGVGALYVRKGTPLVPHLTGGGQESLTSARGLRTFRILLALPKRFD